MTIFGIEKGFFNIASNRHHFMMHIPDEFKRGDMPPVASAYDYMKTKGFDDETIIRKLIRTYIPFRLIKGNHLSKRTLVTGLIGARGSGKSCSASEIVIFDYLIRGIKVWSNMEIKATFKYKDCETTFSTQDVEKLDIFLLDVGLQGGCLFLDEINVEYAEARRSSSNRNLKFTNMMQQLRHRNLDLVYTTQLDTFLDTRLRFQTDFYCICRDAALTPSGREYGAGIGNFTFIDAYDYSGVYTGRNYFKGDAPLWSGILWIKPFWHTYNTFQMQGMDGGPDIAWQIKETERLQILKIKQDKAKKLLNHLQESGIEEVPDDILWQLAEVNTLSERQSLGRQLASLGLRKKDGGNGYIYIVPPSNDNGDSKE